MREAWRVKAAPVHAIKARSDIERLRTYFISNFKKGSLYALILTVGVNTGLRAGDLLSLTVGDVRGKTHLELVEKKTGKLRRIFINGRVYAEIDKHLSKFMFIADEAPLFVANKGCAMTVKTLHKIISSGCKEIALEGNFGSHTLRKTFAHHAYQYAPDMGVIQRLLMHGSVGVTRSYVTPNENECKYTRSEDEIYSSLNL